jgi:DNA-binding transcriptional LysR family regulator
MQFDLALTRTLETLLRERSVTRAARLLGRSQPAISRELVALRKQLDDPLFIRTNSGLMLTPRAEALAAELPHALEQLHSVMRGAVFDPALATGTFRISMSDYEAAVLLPNILRVLADHAPRMRVAIIYRNRPVVEAALNSGDVGLAIGRFDRPGPLLYRKTLFDDEFVMIAGSGREDSKRFGNLDYVLGLPFVRISPSNAGDVRGDVDKRLDELGKSRFVQLSVPHFAVLPSLITSTRYVAFVPKRLVSAMRNTHSIETYNLPLAVDHFEIGMLWHQRTHRDPAFIWLRQLFVEAALAAAKEK